MCAKIPAGEPEDRGEMSASVPRGQFAFLRMSGTYAPPTDVYAVPGAPRTMASSTREHDAYAGSRDEAIMLRQMEEELDVYKLRGDRESALLVIKAMVRLKYGIDL